MTIPTAFNTYSEDFSVPLLSENGSVIIVLHVKAIRMIGCIHFVIEHNNCDDNFELLNSCTPPIGQAVCILPCWLESTTRIEEHDY